MGSLWNENLHSPKHASGLYGQGALFWPHRIIKSGLIRHFSAVWETWCMSLLLMMTDAYYFPGDSPKHIVVVLLAAEDSLGFWPPRHN